MGLFSLKPVPPSILEELSNRASKRGIEWTATRFPWVHVQSFATLKNGTPCPGNIMTSVGDSGPLIGVDQANHYQQIGTEVLPNPVISSITVKKRGELGTTREAIVTFTAFSDEQLGRLQQCFFVPGMTVRVQFGWNTSATKPGSLDGSLLYTDNPQSDHIAVCAMNKLSEKYTNYEGLQGMVSNFTYNLNESNQWECSMTIMSAAEPLADSRIDSSCCNCTAVIPGEDDESKRVVVTELHKFLLQMGEDQKNWQSYAGPKSVFGDHTPLAVSCELAYEGLIRKPSGEAPSFWTLGLKELGGAIANVFSESASDTFITFAALESAINALALPKDKSGLSSLGELRSSDTIMRSHPSLESVDPRICMIGGTKYFNTIITEVVEGTVPKAYSSTGVVLGSILLNTVFLSQEIQSNDGVLDSFLRSVLSKVNQACGNLWDLEVVNTTENCESDNPNKLPTISVIDLAGVKPVQPTVIPTTAQNSAVRALTLNMKLTDAMKTQALYSNRLETTSQTCNNDNPCPGVGLAPFGLVPDSKGEVRVLNSALKPSAKREDRQSKCNCGPANKEPEPPPTFQEVIEELASRVDEASVASALTALDSQYSDPKQQAANAAACNMLITPFEFGFTVDGIGGFKFGQAVSSDRIPAEIAKRFLFQITAVEHTVTAHDWATTVTTIARTNSKLT